MTMSHEVIFLSDADVRSMLTMPAVMEAVEADFQRQAKPDSMIVGVPLAYETDDRKLGFRWRLKTAVIRDLPIAGTRITGYKIDSSGVGSGGDRTSTRYLILSDPNTSMPLAIIDEHTSFSMRTSASVCVAAKYLARRESKAIGIIGVGNIGKTLLPGLMSLFPIADVRVMSRRAESRSAFAKEQSTALGLPVRAVDSYEDACRGADIIMTATPSTVPFLKYEWLKDGAFVGLMGLEEAEHDVYRKCDRLFVDYNPATEKHPAHIRHAVESGAILPDKPIRQIWEAVSGKLPARQNERQKIVAATVGLTTQDTSIAYALYLQAKADGRGIRLPF
jgi:ornithine cyclodeaminase/alanine dehydrogenase-like protein (mu-crystallin family)